MAWRLTAGGGGKLNMIKMINAGPYRGGLCEFGHRVPGPVPRPVPNSFTGWGGQQTDPGSLGHGLSGKPKYVALGGLDHKEHPDPGSAVGVLLVHSGAQPRSITRP
jgi:hypothetical protein